jgi:PHD/YefM family antitoxin component YafN of YafNO toxin-antitoxin module
MKEIAIEKEQRPFAEWLPREDSNDVVYLTKGGRKRFVVVPLDDMDEEVLAIRKNAKLMAHIDRLADRARKGPTKSLAEIKAKYGIKDKKPKRGAKQKVRKP